MRPAWLRISLLELVVEIVILSAPPISTITLAILGDFEPVYVVLIGIGTVLMVVMTIAHYEWWRRPLRRRPPSDKELIGAIDDWLGGINYGRRFIEMQGYTQAMEVTIPAGAGAEEVKMWVTIDSQRKTLWFMGQRSDGSNYLVTQMTPQKAAEIKYDLALEIARMGAFYDPVETPVFSVTFWDSMPIDDRIDVGKVLDRVMFIQRIDFLMRMVFQKNLLTATSPTSPPHVSQLQNGDDAGKASPPTPSP